MIAVVFAQASGVPPQGRGWETILLFGAIFAIMYFLLFRPQQKKQKEHQAMVAALKKGDKIISSGGLHGVITGVSDDTITMEIAPKVRVKITRVSVAGKLN